MNISKNNKISKNTWNKLAKEDAEFYILTKREKRGNKWEKDDFLNVGKEQWFGFKKLLRRYDLSQIVSKDKTALDLGCGIGRITFAMARDFQKVEGVDVSEVMINKANELKKELEINNIDFLVNNGSDLRKISDSSIDFVFSYIALQHCPNQNQTINYINEFSRILKKDGVGIFQLRIAPGFFEFSKMILSKKISQINNILKKNQLKQNAFLGNWVRLGKIQKILNQNFENYHIIQIPFEIYNKKWWKAKKIEQRWRRSFIICIK